MLLNRHILVGICGGIACYKAVELVSRLQQAGALVDVIMSERADEFVRPLTFSSLSHRPIYSDLWEPSGRAAETHIALAEEAELLVVAPATEARDRGAHVILISGPVVLDVPYGVEVRRVETAIQMRDAVYGAVIDADVLVMSAAVADFRPSEVATQKLKKSGSGSQELD